MFPKLSIYEITHIANAAEVESTVFAALKDDPNGGIDTVQKFRDGAESLLQDYDRRWVTLCDGDETELIDWAVRMGFIRARFDELDRQLAVKDRPRLLNWGTIGRAMGHINSFRVAVEQVLTHNESLEAAV